LRWAVPIFLVIAFVANLCLVGRPIYRLLFLGQLALYLAALIAWVFERRNVRLPGLVIPLYFCVVNLAPLLAVRAIWRGERKVIWETGGEESGRPLSDGTLGEPRQAEPARLEPVAGDDPERGHAVAHAPPEV